MTHEEFRKILSRYRQGLCSAEEERLVDEWYALVGKENDSSNNNSIEDDSLEKEYWKAIQDHVASSPSGERPDQKQRIFFTWHHAGIAASVIFIIGILFLFQERPARQNIDPVALTKNELKSIFNQDTKPQVVVLPDSSTIELSPGSRIDFSEAFDAPSREVYLEGEAFFDVSRDEQRPFLVYAGEVITKVLGTSFKVKALRSDKDITVEVRTGKVCVYKNAEKPDESHQTILAPNQQVIYNRAEDEIRKELVAVPVPLISINEVRKTEFEGAPVEEIFKALEERYGVDIVVDEHLFRQCTLTTTISDNEIFKRLEIICKAIGATYKVEETRIMIEGPGCH